MTWTPGTAQFMCHGDDISEPFHHLPKEGNSEALRKQWVPVAQFTWRLQPSHMESRHIDLCLHFQSRLRTHPQVQTHL